jgi:ankyrin repeat protein
MKKRFNITLLMICLAVGPAGCGLLAPATYNTVEYQAIHQAALDGDMGKLKEQIKANPHLVNVGDYDKNTPLHLAASHGHADAAEFLLENGANVNAQNSAEMTSLHLAAKQGFIDVVKVLLSRKPDLNIKDSRGWTPLTWAEKTHHDEIANLLRENGAH